MSNLGSLAVIKRKCVQCGKLYEPQLETDLFCSMGCYLEFDREGESINEAYQWHTEISNSNRLVWVRNEVYPEMRIGVGNNDPLN